MTILSLPGCGDRVRRLDASPPSLDELAQDLGDANDWLNAAVVYLKDKTSGRDDGAVEVSVCALHLVLAHMERLEAREAEADRPGAA